MLGGRCTHAHIAHMHTQGQVWWFKHKVWSKMKVVTSSCVSQLRSVPAIYICCLIKLTRTLSRLVFLLRS